VSQSLPRENHGCDEPLALALPLRVLGKAAHWGSRYVLVRSRFLQFGQTLENPGDESLSEPRPLRPRPRTPPPFLPLNRPFTGTSWLTM
jgi:hypothetical protein